MTPKSTPTLTTAQVLATFDNLDGTPPTSRQVVLELRDDYVHMRGGPTGYESLPAATVLGGRDWYACVGTPGRWAQCIVPIAEMERAFAELGLGTTPGTTKHGTLGLGSPWTRALFPGELRAKTEGLIPTGYRINVTAVDGKPGPWRVTAFQIVDDSEVGSWVTHSPVIAVRLMAERLHKLAATA